MTGEAMRMRMQLARLAQRHGHTPKSFTPTDPLPPIDGDVIVEGLASLAVIDNQRTKVAAHCWMPFRKSIPLLFRHGRPAGEVLEVRNTDKGLHVRSLVHDEEAKRYSHFSVTATVHGFQLRDVDDPERFHALITRHRYRQSPAVECYDLAKRGIICIAKLIELMAAPATLSTAPPAHERQPPRCAPAHIIMRKPPTAFSKLVWEMTRNEQRQRQGRA
jgi:hypothetical protein